MLHRDGNIVVGEIQPTGQISKWNASMGMGRQVEMNDMLVRVNGLDSGDGMVGELKCNLSQYFFHGIFSVGVSP